MQRRLQVVEKPPELLRLSRIEPVMVRSQSCEVGSRFDEDTGSGALFEEFSGGARRGAAVAEDQPVARAGRITLGRSESRRLPARHVEVVMSGRLGAWRGIRDLLEPQPFCR